jgi:hypothetical protein
MSRSLIRSSQSSWIWFLFESGYIDQKGREREREDNFSFAIWYKSTNSKFMINNSTQDLLHLFFMIIFAIKKKLLLHCCLAVARDRVILEDLWWEENDNCRRERQRDRERQRENKQEGKHVLSFAEWQLARGERRTTNRKRMTTNKYGSRHSCRQITKGIIIIIIIISSDAKLVPPTP